MTTLPHSAAHAVVYSLSKTMADFLHAVLGCLQRLGGVPEAMVVDNDASIVAAGVGKRAVLHPEVAALCGQLGMRLVVLEPGRPESKGQVERTNGYLETSFLPLRCFHDLADLQAQSHAWAEQVAWRRHHRRVGGRVADALAAERRFLRALPDPLPDVDVRTEVRVQRDGLVRVRGSTTRSRRDWSAARSRSGCLPQRWWSAWRAPRSPATSAATPPPTSCSTPVTPGPCAWPERPALAFKPAT